MGYNIKPAHHQNLCGPFAIKKLERMMGFEPTTSTLARLRSTPELHPLENIGALQRPCAGKYIRFFGLGKIFFREKILFSRNTYVGAGVGTQQKKVFWFAMRVAPSLVDAVFGKTVEGCIKTGLFRKDPFCLPWNNPVERGAGFSSFWPREHGVSSCVR